MTELRITRGSDIELYADGELLFGVTDFRAVSTGSSREIHEYLCSQPVVIVNSAEKHELTLSVLSLFNYNVFDNTGFTLSVVDGDTAYDYEGCSAVRCERRIQADKNVSDRYTLIATKLTKRGLADE